MLMTTLRQLFRNLVDWLKLDFRSSKDVARVYVVAKHVGRERQAQRRHHAHF